MRFSPLKMDIILLIIRDFDPHIAQDLIRQQLNINTEQMFHVIDFLMQSQFISFKEGKLELTHTAYSLLNERNLDKFSFKNIESYKFKVNEEILENYIPKF